MGAVIGGALAPSASILGKNARASGEARSEYGTRDAGAVTVPSGCTPARASWAEAGCSASRPTSAARDAVMRIMGLLRRQQMGARGRDRGGRASVDLARRGAR